jgi:hypothetical protein
MALTIEQKPLAEVARTLSEKTPVGSVLRSAEWENVPAALRESAFFSARVESVRALADAQANLRKVLTMARDPNGAISMDRGKFIAELQKTANALGLRNPDPNKRGGLEDFGSERRLKLIFEQQIGQAQSKAYYLSGQDPDVLDGWPAQELVRLRPAAVPRNWARRWAEAGGQFFDGGRMIALKTDPIWSRISRFGRAYPPFDYGSGMGLEEIDRETAEAFGLIKPGERLTPSVKRDQEELEASVKGLPDDMRAALQAAFGNQISINGDKVRWTAQKKDAETRRRGDRKPEIANQTKTTDDTPIDGTRPADTSQSASSRPDGRSEELPAAERAARRDPEQTRRLGETARGAFREVFARWDGQGVPADERALNQAVEAQVAAASQGHKPLYFDPWGREAASQLAEALRGKLAPGTEVHASGENLLIFQPAAVRLILDSDPAFYRPNGEDDLAAIARVSEMGENGELLGYGARNPSIAAGAKVTISNAEGYTQVFFVSNPAEAPRWAAERAADIEAYTGRAPEIEILYQE